MLGTWLTWEVAQGLLRNILLGLGASLVTSGAISQTSLETGVGAIVVIAGIAFSAISNRNKATANAVVRAVEDHPQLSVLPADYTATGKPVVIIKPDLPPKSLTQP